MSDKEFPITMKVTEEEVRTILKLSEKFVNAVTAYCIERDPKLRHLRLSVDFTEKE